jgi:hypothetical protein
MTSILPGGVPVLINALKSLSGSRASSESLIQLSFSTSAIRLQFFQETVAFDTRVSVVCSPPPATNDEIAVKVNLADFINGLNCCHTEGDLQFTLPPGGGSLRMSTSDGLSEITCDIRLLSDSVFTNVVGIPQALLENGIVASMTIEADTLACALQQCLDSQFVSVCLSEDQTSPALLALKSVEQKGGISTEALIPFSAAENIQIRTETPVSAFTFSILGKDAEKLYSLLTVPGAPKLELIILRDAIRCKRKLLSNHEGDLVILTTV